MSNRLRVFHQLNVAHSALFRAANQHALRKTGLSAARQGVLFLLGRSDGLPVSAIAKDLAMSKSSTTELIMRMETHGLVERRASVRDARVRHVLLTDKGRAELDGIKARVATYNRHLLAPFDCDEQQVIARFLTHVAENAEAIINTPPSESDDD